MIVNGACHCGNIRFALDWGSDAPEIPARACSCSFCMKHGGVWTSNAAAKLRVTFEQPQEVSRYAFGTGTATFHVCSRCGVVPVVTSEIDRHVYAVVNVNTFQDLDPARLGRASADFEGEALDARLARRKRNWIADVRIGG